MKQTLVVLAVFAVAFAATLLLSRDLFRPKPIGGGVEIQDRDPIGAGGFGAKHRADIDRTMIPKDTADVVREIPAEAGAASAPTVGEIEGTVRTDDGVEPAELRVSVFPAATEPRLLGGGRFQLADLAPGTYYVGVSAVGYVARQPVEATVQAGKKYAVELWLERGFELRGTVIDDTEQRPIQGASIDFNGLAHATSDAYGAFHTPIVSEKALELITVTHDDFERNVLIHPVMPEHTGIVIAMSRGKGTVIGRVIPPGGQIAPQPFRVRIWRIQMPGYEELRRERLCKDWQFEIKGAFPGPSVLEVAFPGTTIATRRVEFDLGRESAIHLDVDLARGGRIEGTYTTPTSLVASIPILLVDGQNHPMGEVRTDADGKFQFDHVAEGDYAIRIDARIPPLHTESFKVKDGKAATLTVDGQTGRLR